MMTLADFNRLTARIRGKIQLLVGRAILAAVDNTSMTQKVQVVALADETITGVERFQEYGLETMPSTDAEVLAVFLSGNRDQGIAVCVHDRRYRPKDLSEGEVVLYTKWDGVSKEHRIRLKNGKEIEVVGTLVKIGAISGHKAVCLEDLVDGINSIIIALNAHQHTETGVVTSVPLVPISSLVKTNLVTKEVQLT